MHAESWPGTPYKGLAYYEPGDVAVFIGRETEILDCAELVSKAKTRVLLLHGSTGCGKSSFLRAGLIPHLESRVPLFRFMPDFNKHDTKALFIQSTDDPLLRLSEKLYEWAARPFPLEVAADEPPKHIDITPICRTLADLVKYPKRTTSVIYDLMTAMTLIYRLLPRSLILVIDQCEQVLTVKRGADGERSRDLFFEFLDAFNTSTIGPKLVVAFRTEHFGKFDNEMRKRHYQPSELASFLLEPLTRDKLIEAIRFPTRRDLDPMDLEGRCQPGEHYKFEFDEGVAEMIVDRLITKKDQELTETKIQIQCSRIYHHTKSKNANIAWKINESHYNWSGDPERQVRLYLDEKLTQKIVQHMPNQRETAREDELIAWKDVLYSLVVKGPRGDVQTDICSESQLRRKAEEFRCKLDFDAMTLYLAENDQRILRVDRRGDESSSYYSLGHDGIALELSEWRRDRELFIEKRDYIDKGIRGVTEKVGRTLLAVAVPTLVILGYQVWRPIWISVFGTAIVIALILLGASTRIGKSLSRRIANTHWFRRVAGSDQEQQSEQTREAIRRLQESLTAGHAAQPSTTEREALKGAEEALRAKPEKDYTAADWAERAFAAYADGKLDLAAEYFGQAAASDGVSQAQRAEYLFNRGALFSELQRDEEALTAYDDAIPRSGDTAGPALRELVAKTLRNKGVTLSRLHRSDDELDAYDELLARFKDATEPALREQVAVALFNKGVALDELQRSEAALAAYNEVIERFRDAAEPVVREQVAKALLNKGIRLGQLQRNEEELAAYNELLERFKDASEPPLRELVANALFNKGVRLGALDRSAEEIAVYDDLLARFGTATEPPLREQVAKALVNKGVRLGALDRSAEEIAVYDDLLARFGTATEPPLREQVAMALFNKGFRLGALGRGAEEIAVYDDLLARFGTATELPLREPVAKALVNKGLRLGALDRGAEEVAVYDDLLARFGTATEPPLREQVAKALLNKGVALGALDRSTEAIAVYDDLLARFGTATELPLRELVAKAIVNKGVRLGALDRSTEEVAVYDDLLARFGTATELSLREQVAKGLVNKGVALGSLGRSAEEIAVYDDLPARFGSATELPLREQVAKALLNKGITLGQLQRRGEELAAYDDLIARFGDATEPGLREQVEEARRLRAGDEKVAAPQAAADG